MKSMVPILLGGAASFLIVLQGLVWMQARRARGRRAPETRTVDGPAATDRIRVYYFFAEHCAPCRAMRPLIERLCGTHRNLVRLDIAESRELARAFGVVATPCFIQVVDGVVRQVKLGGLSETRLMRLLQQN